MGCFLPEDCDEQEHFGQLRILGCELSLDTDVEVEGCSGVTLSLAARAIPGLFFQSPWGLCISPVEAITMPHLVSLSPVDASDLREVHRSSGSQIGGSAGKGCSNYTQSDD